VSTVLTQAVARVLLAPILLVALAVLVKGYASVGDGFAAGVIAALGILLQYLAFGREEVERLLPVRRVPVAGFAGLTGALALALLGPVLGGAPLLTHFPRAGEPVTKLGTLELTTAVAFDLAVFVLVLGAAVGIVHALARQSEDGET